MISPKNLGPTRAQQVWGVYSGGVTPDPISNSEVKPAHGKTSTEEARRKASSMPHFIRNEALIQPLLDRGFVLFTTIEREGASPAGTLLTADAAELTSLVEFFQKMGISD